jgi:hypothetical protein
MPSRSGVISQMRINFSAGDEFCRHARPTKCSPVG